MSWSYDPNQSTSRDVLRSKIGDTNSADPIFADEELDAFLLQASDDVLAAGIIACGAAAAKYIRQPTSWSNLNISVSYAEWSAAWRRLAADLTAERAKLLGGATMLVGGLTVAGNDALDQDATKVQPWARQGIDQLGRPWR